VKETMSDKSPKDDPRRHSDWPSSKQTDKPWKGVPEKEQAPPVTKPDLEKWNDSNTH
jgi:hypothetical protein